MSLAATITEAIRLRDQMRADGATGLELARDFETAVRSMWPFTREWRYLCETCRDYGLDMKVCPGDATCGRVFPHAPHDYGVPCWCQAWNRYKAKQKDGEDYVGAGKSRKPSRWGTR